MTYPESFLLKFPLLLLLFLPLVLCFTFVLFLPLCHLPGNKTLYWYEVNWKLNNNYYKQVSSLVQI